MNIFIQIKNSVYGKEYYKSTVLVESLRSSIKYLLKIVAIFALVMMIILVVSAPSMVKVVKGIVSSTITSLPDDFVLSVKEGAATLNQPMPFVIKLPEALKNLDKEKATLDSNKVNFDNLIVINTDESFYLDKFKEYSTFLLLTKSEFSVFSSNGEVKVTSLSNASKANIAITKPWLLEKQSQIYKAIPWVSVVVILFVYIMMFIFGFIANAVVCFLYALAVWFFYKKSGTDITYGRAYQVAIHASTLTLFVGLILSNFFFKLLILMVIIYINYDKPVKNEGVALPVEKVKDVKEEEVKS